MTPPPVPTTLCIELNAGENLESTVYRLEKGWILRFTLGRGLYAQPVRIVITPGNKELVLAEPTRIDDFDTHADYVCDQFGSFHFNYYLKDAKIPTGSGYFHIVPEWSLGSKKISVNGLSCITHLTKLLGPLSEWESRLEVSHQAGYNLLHLTPIQTLGVSNSSYSIADYQAPNPSLGPGVTFDDVDALLRRIENNWGVLAIQDVVWNHVAKNAPWLQEHPESGFNCVNSPHLRPAYILDRALVHFSRRIGAGEYADRGLPAVIDNDGHLGALRWLLETEVLPPLKLYEFFQLDVPGIIQALRSAVGTSTFDTVHDGSTDWIVEQDLQFRRKSSTVNIDAAVRRFLQRIGHNRGNTDAENGLFAELEAELKARNDSIRNDQTAALHGSIVNALMGHVQYERVAGHGPRYGLVTDELPLVTNYFLHPYKTTDVAEDERDAFDAERGRLLLACNGWVMCDDPMRNFAVYPSQVYLRRELICWGDCVKLNYGDSPEHSPFLWEYMTKYTETCARLFHGFRIDNCHSTPINVAQYLLEKARAVRPHLYVSAELFTGSEQLDNVFVNKLGISSLIREAQNAPDSHEQGRFVYRYGGDPVGGFRSKATRPALPHVAHALFYDQTHDNPPPAQKRTAYDHVPTAAMTSIAYCASGSNRGYDEFVPFRIDVVKEERLYATWAEVEARGGGMVRARKLFNDLHADLAAQGYNEIFVDQVNVDVVAVTRHNPATRESVLVVSHTCFSGFNWNAEAQAIHIEDEIADILFEVKTVELPEPKGDDEDEPFIAGNSKFVVEIYEHPAFDKCLAVGISPSNDIYFKSFTSGSVIAFKINPKQSTTNAVRQIESTVSSPVVADRLAKAVEPLSLQTLNYILYRCESEEQSEHGAGAYEVAVTGKLVYAGIEGVQPVIRRIHETNDLGHPLCQNLRDGTWLVGYYVARLERLPQLAEIAKIFKEAFAPLDDLPNFLRPCYFELVFSYLRNTIVDVALSKLTVVGNTRLGRALALNSIVLTTDIRSARMPPVVDPVLEPGDSIPSSLSAGLPHFSEGIWRNWGRDTFIALPGLLLATGRFADARSIILAYGGALRHGLIPNLLGEGKCSRYNCRDAVWFWLAAIVNYIDRVPNGAEILKAPVRRIYPTDDSPYDADSTTQPLQEVINEALQRHFAGISFRERNAGWQIDDQMSDNGFNVDARIDRVTGFVAGGNPDNCGTWMDKMGSSVAAGNKGRPATPRDGAAVELQGLALYVAERLAQLHASGAFPHGGLSADSEHWTWSDWARRLRENFPKQFFVDDSTQDEYVNRRFIVKDSVGSSAGYTDFQLRPNFAVALSLVPDILDVSLAGRALDTATKVLVGPLGIKTLDPSDYAYRGYYDNNNQGTDRAVAHGWNYHQGPEWLWLAGVHLRALVVNASLSGDPERKASVLAVVKERLHAYRNYIHNDAWQSLPELTNENGSPCFASAKAQAWSVSCLIEAIEALKDLIKV